MRFFILGLLLLFVTGCVSGKSDQRFCENQYPWTEQSIDSLENN